VFYLYTITENETGKTIYVGSTKNIAKRFMLHRSAAFSKRSAKRNMALYTYIRSRATAANFTDVFQINPVGEFPRRNLNAESAMIATLIAAGHTLFNINRPTRHVGARLCCSYCGQLKSKKHFYTHKMHGFQDKCKSCNTICSRKRRNKESI
jgi:hypothetical protein